MQDHATFTSWRMQERPTKWTLRVILAVPIGPVGADQEQPDTRKPANRSAAKARRGVSVTPGQLSPAAVRIEPYRDSRPRQLAMLSPNAGGDE